MKLLIDENLSPVLARQANLMGIPAAAVRDVGLAGASDARVWRHAWDNDQIVVTANFGDFLRLATGYELHPGIIALREAGLSRAEQWQRLSQAIEWVRSSRAGGLINQVLEVCSPSVMQLHDIPPPLPENSPPGV